MAVSRSARAGRIGMRASGQVRDDRGLIFDIRYEPGRGHTPSAVAHPRGVSGRARHRERHRLSREDVMHRVGQRDQHLMRTGR